MRIGIIGSGNVATHLALAFRQNGYSIPFVFSRNKENAASLAEKVGAIPLDNLLDLPATFDVLLIAIKDDAIKGASKSLTYLKSKDKFILHTSGSIPSTALKDHPNFGVFYPLQTFSKEKEVVLNQVPFCIHGNNSTTIELGKQLAGTLSKSVFTIDDQQRSYLHVAAVFANNFVNHLNGHALEICKENNIPVSLLYPLMKETLEKALNNNPFSVQTGPASRGDQKVMQKQQDLLSDSAAKSELYKMMSKLIVQSTKNLNK